MLSLLLLLSFVIFDSQAIFKLANTAKSASRVRDSSFAASLVDDITDEEDEDPAETTKLSIGRHAKQVSDSPLEGMLNR